MDQNEMSNLYRGPSIDASCQVSYRLAKRFQKSTNKKQELPTTASDWSISKKSSTLKQLGQMDRNVVGSIYGRSSIKIANFVPIG
jgi:hypothetical protein